MKLVHHSSLGALEIPGVPGVVKPGEPFEATGDLARSLLRQADVFERVEETPTRKPDGEEKKK